MTPTGPQNAACGGPERVRAIKGLEAVVKKSSELGIDFISRPKTTAVFKTFSQNSIYMQWGSCLLDITQGEDELFAKMSPHHRRLIRKARRDKIYITSGPELLENCHELVKWTMNRQRKKSVSLKQMRSYQEHLGNQVHFYLASINNENQGCAVLISDGVGSYFIHGGSRVGAHHGAVALLHWEAMLDMKKKGLRVYDFIGGRINPIPGSKQEGIQN